MFELPELPYSFTALEPYIDAQTMQLHHDMHHKAYVTKLNDALDDKSINDIIKVNIGAAHAKVAVRNNGGGHYNHSLFWKWMSPVGETNPAPFGTLKTKIEERWGSFDAMRAEFNQTAANRFGSGWAWLGVKPDGQLDICSTANQDNPLMQGIAEKEMIPILGLDVWEHAYYLKYQNRRPEYIDRWWNVVNWDTVVKGYDEYAAHGKIVPIEI